MSKYTISHTTPTLETFLSLRRSASLSPFTPAAATIGLRNTLFAVQTLVPSDPSTLPTSDKVIGMGRVIGDGGCFFQVVDIAVRPLHQGQGVGKMILGEIKAWLNGNVPESGFVSLMADGRARELYAKYGFEDYPGGVGMSLVY